MFKANLKQLKEFEADLKGFAHRAYPFATKETLNSIAFHTRDVAKKVIAKKMTLRNKFTARTIKVHKVQGLNVNTQNSVIGTTVDYLLDQEFGKTETKSGRIGVAIPTTFSAGQRGVKPRTRLPRARNKLKNIRLSKSRKNSTLLAVINAVKTGDRFIYLELKKSKGIFKVVGGSKRSKGKGWPQGAKLEMVYDLSSTSIVKPANPWLQPAFKIGIRKMPELYFDALKFQVIRQGLFK